MSDPRLNAAVEAALDCALDAVWRQWRAVGAPVAGGSSRAAQSIVDLEALVLLSLVLREEERRLDDMLGWWAEAGAGLLSVQRIATLAGAFPDSARGGLREFASTAAAAGDRRWKKFGTGAVSEGIVHRGKGRGVVQMESGPALMLKLRAGFGVGVKADLLSILIGLSGTPTTIRTLAAASSYTLVAVRSAAQEMVRARIVRSTPERPAAYFVDARGWLDLLFPAPPQSDTVPLWRFWGQVFAFLAGVLEWGGGARDSRVSTYVHGSRARDLYEGHQGVFTLNRIALPETEAYRGPEFLTVFGATVERLSTWIKESV
jgi:hypothetical protein